MGPTSISINSSEKDELDLSYVGKIQLAAPLKGTFPDRAPLGLRKGGMGLPQNALGG